MTESEWNACRDPGAMLGRLMAGRVVAPGAGPATGPHVEDILPPRISDRKLRLWVEAQRCDECDRHTKGMTPAEAGEYVADASCGSRFRKAVLLRDIVGNPFAESVVACPRCGSRRHCPCPWLTPQVLSLARAAYDERPGRECINCGGDKAIRSPMGGGGIVACPACHGTGRIEDGLLDPLRLMVLADALEEAGCAEEPCPHLFKKVDLDKQDGAEAVIAWGRARKACPRCRGACRLPHPLLAHLRSPGPHVRGCHALDAILGES